MHIPDITEVQRLRLEPGDKLVVHLNTSHLEEATAQAVREQVRDALALAAGFPVMILARGVQVEVLNS